MVYNINYITMKQYITWINHKKNTNNFQHPNTNWFADSIDSDFIFHETQYTWPKNPVLQEYVWTLEYPDTKTNWEIAQYKSWLSKFQLKDKTEVEINALLNTRYAWDVTVTDFVFTDNRPMDI